MSRLVSEAPARPGAGAPGGEAGSTDADLPGSPKPHVHRVIVGPEHLDSVGHLNNARYFEFFEAGRTTWYDEGGLTAVCAQAGFIDSDTVVVNIRCDFMRECLAGEQLTVLTWPVRLGGKSFSVRQHLLKADGTLSAEATVTSVVMDLRSRQAVPLPRALERLFPSTPASVDL